MRQYASGMRAPPPSFGAVSTIRGLGFTTYPRNRRADPRPARNVTVVGRVQCDFTGRHHRFGRPSAPVSHEHQHARAYASVGTDASTMEAGTRVMRREGPCVDHWRPPRRQRGQPGSGRFSAQAPWALFRASRAVAPGPLVSRPKARYRCLPGGCVQSDPGDRHRQGVGHPTHLASITSGANPGAGWASASCRLLSARRAEYLHEFAFVEGLGRQRRLTDGEHLASRGGDDRSALLECAERPGETDRGVRG